MEVSTWICGFLVCILICLAGERKIRQLNYENRSLQIGLVLSDHRVQSAINIAERLKRQYLGELEARRRGEQQVLALRRAQEQQEGHARSDVRDTEERGREAQRQERLLLRGVIDRHEAERQYHEGEEANLRSKFNGLTSVTTALSAALDSAELQVIGLVSAIEECRQTWLSTFGMGVKRASAD